MKKVLFCCSLLLLSHAHADDAPSTAVPEPAGSAQMRAWTAYPTLKSRSGGAGREHEVNAVMARNIVADHFDAYSSSLDDPGGHRRLQAGMAGAVLDKPQIGGFHWLSAREERRDLIKVATTVHYFGNPGRNPDAMFMLQKNELEVIPQPYPREHARYRANEDWQFLVRFNSRPLAVQKVTLETSNGSRVELISDAKGIVKLHLPDDFKAGPGQAGRKTADFVLATEHQDAGRSYLTAFNSGYGPDAYAGRSLAWGLGFTFLGMVGAMPLLRQRRQGAKHVDAVTVNQSRES